MVGDTLQVGVGGTGNEVIGIGHAVGGALPAVYDGGNLGHFGIDEEEEFVLHDGAAEGETVGGAAVLVAGAGDLLSVHGVTLHVLVLVVDVGGTLEGVGTGLGDGVHAAADEVGLANVVGADHNLQFLDGVDGDGVAAAGQVGGQTEVVVEVGAVNGEVGGTAVGTGEAHAVAAVRGKAGDVGDATVHSGHGRNLGTGDVGHGTRALLGIELGTGGSDDNGAFQHFIAFGNLGVQREGLCELKGNAGVGGFLITKAGEIYLVRTAGTHTLDGIAAIGIGNGTVNGTGRLVRCHDGSADDRLAGLVNHTTGKGGCGHLGIGDSARNQRSECEQKAFKSFSHRS